VRVGMGELERQRRARDLWISRGHVVAYITGTGLLALLMLAFGFHLGRGSVDEAQGFHGSSLVSGAPDQDLIRVLDRVDAMKDPLGHQQMTFPELRDPAAVGEGVKPVGFDGDHDKHVASTRIELDVPGEQVFPDDDRLVQPLGWVVVWGESHDVQDVVMLQERLLSSGNLQAELGWGHEGERLVFWLMHQGFSSQSEAQSWADKQGGFEPDMGIQPPVVREFLP
jgi:hypothetical protein